MQESAKLFYAGSTPVRNSKSVMWVSGEVGESRRSVKPLPQAE